MYTFAVHLTFDTYMYYVVVYNNKFYRLPYMFQLYFVQKNILRTFE